MTTEEQIKWLCALGARLDLWTTPGNDEDYLGDKAQRLWTEQAKNLLPAPARVSDVLMLRWMRIKDFVNQTPVAFLMNAVQRDLSKRRTRRNIALKAGRIGLTINEMMLALLHTTTHQGYTSVLVSLDKESAENYFTQVRFAFDNMMAKSMGDEFRKGALRTEKKNVRELYFPALNSHFFIETAGNYAPAQGESIQYLICDEMARWKTGNPKQVIGTLLSHLTGSNTRATFLSRPYGQSGEFYERYWAARRGESNFTPFFYQWWWQGGHVAEVPGDFVRKPEEEQRALSYAAWRRQQEDCELPLELTDGQLVWFRQQEKEIDDLATQEFAEDEAKCFMGSGNCPFSAQSIAVVLNDTTEPVETNHGAGESENGLIRWKEPDPASWYVLFLDPAGGLGTSRLAFNVVNGETGEQVAEWVGRCDAATAAAISADIGIQYRSVVMAFESNLGEISATIAGVWAGPTYAFSQDSWPRMYYEQDAGYQWRMGHKTDGGNRGAMLAAFGKLWRDQPGLFHSHRLANEVRACIRKGDRIEHGPGMTDDIVMSQAGVHWVRAKTSGAPIEAVFEVGAATGTHEEMRQARLERTFKKQVG